MTDGSETDAGSDRTAPPSTKPRIPTPRLLVDVDACLVKEEIYKVACRRNMPVVLVNNARFPMPDHPLITSAIVSDSFDAAEDWIARAAGADTRSIVITADILLADRCLKAGAVVIGNNGKPFTAASIGSAIDTRAIKADLRAGIGKKAWTGLAAAQRLFKSRPLTIFAGAG